MKTRWLSLAACLALTILTPGSTGRATAADELQGALNRAWSAHSFRLSFVYVRETQGDSGFVRQVTSTHRAEFTAGPNGRYTVNLVATEGAQPLTQTLYMPLRSCLRPRAWLAWGCADRSVDGQISDSEGGWMRYQPFLLRPDLPMRIADKTTQRIGSRLVHVYAVDLGGYALVHVAIDRATDTIMAVGVMSVSLSYHDIWVLRYGDWNDRSIVTPSGTQGAVPLPAPLRHPLVAVPSNGAQLALLWPIYLYPTSGQAGQFKTVMRRAMHATSVDVSVQYVDGAGSHGTFAGQMILSSNASDVDFAGSVDGLPRVEVAVTSKQECARHPGRLWSCLDIQQNTHYPVLDVLSVVPFLTAERKGTMLFVGTAMDRGRVLDRYLVLNGVDRTITVSVDRQTGMLASVLLHVAGLGVEDVRVSYGNWNASSVTFPVLPSSS